MVNKEKKTIWQVQEQVSQKQKEWQGADEKKQTAD